MRNETKKIIADKKLMEFLGGLKGFETFNPNSDFPTFPEKVLDDLEEYLISSEESRQDFRKALVSLSADSRFGWVAIYYVSCKISFEQKHKISLVPQETIDQIGKNLLSNRDTHLTNKNWVGSTLQDGVWGDIKRMNKILFELDDISVLPIELES